jgi:hypothetical protein
MLSNFQCRSVKSVRYDISLWDIEFAGDWKYRGLVKIDTRIVKATKEILLNAKELDIQRAKLWTAEAKSTYHALRVDLPHEVSTRYVLLTGI